MRFSQPKPPIRLSLRHERWVYRIGAVLFLSGIGWLVAHYFFTRTGEFGEIHQASEPWWLRLHGAAAMAALIVLGSLLPNHIVPAWRLRKNFASGLLMIGILAILILTGYGLYYLGDERTRPWISAIHWVIGILAVGGVWLHVRLGRPKP